MAKWEKGERPEGQKPISKENAKEYAQRSAETRRRNRTIRECVLAELMKPSSFGSKTTKMQSLVTKALSNGDIDIRDIKLLQDILGESITNIAITKPEIKVATEDDAQAIRDLIGDNEADRDIPQD